MDKATKEKKELEDFKDGLKTVGNDLEELRYDASVCNPAAVNDIVNILWNLDVIADNIKLANDDDVKTFKAFEKELNKQKDKFMENCVCHPKNVPESNVTRMVGSVL